MSCNADILNSMKRLPLVLMICWPLAELAAQNATHAIEAGETLYSIARHYGVSVADLSALNQIAAPELVPIGSLLKIPSKENQAPAAVQEKFYTVKQGDTYYSIARSHGIKVSQLLAANSRNEQTLLKPGERLTLQAAPLTAVVESARPPINSSAPAVLPQIFPPVPAIANTSQQTKVAQGSLWPASGAVSQYEGKQRGVKITVAGDQSIKAVASGTVVHQGPYRELGNVVLVDHPGGYIYIYGGFDSVFVKRGQQVEAGATLGKVSGTRRNITFSVFKDSNPIDPQHAPRD